MPDRPPGLALLAFLAAASWGAGCARTPESPRPPGSPPGVTPLAPGAVPRAVAGGTIYVPIYSHIYTGDRARAFNLAATLYVRNPDRARPLVLTAVNYHGASGAALRSYLDAPLQVAPLAAAEFFVKESDVSGGSAASFLVEWSAGASGEPPLAEAVMVGTLMNQGVTISTSGRPVAGQPDAAR